ncbi:hypothetical protein [Yinghuangia sp. YIM S09857]|uniref:hypothetical protein n=1 Tax=Yinghuangia sp. YIM S09857 TaxID=3436929 RepID=UPI003F52F9D6
MDRHLAVVDDLRTRPFATDDHRGRDGEGGPGWHLRDLEVSRDFWEDSERHLSEDVWEEYEARAAALADTLDVRYASFVRDGGRRTVGLAPYFERAMNGELLPEPLDHLTNFVVRLYVWTFADRDRWLGIGVGQYDKELPVQLIATVAAGPGPR